MGLINNAHGGSQLGVLNAIVHSIQAIGKNKAVNRDLLQSYCAPETMLTKDNHRGKFKMELDFWISVGLINDKSNKVSLNFDLDGPKSIWREARRALLRKKNWETSNDLHEPLCFFYGANLTFMDIEKITEAIKNNSDITFNSNVKPYFEQHAHTFGYSTKLGNKFIADPTSIINEEIHTSNELKVDTEIKISDFISLISNTNPLLDGGEIRTQVEKKYGLESLFKAGMVSFSLSLALQRMVRSGMIELRMQSDTTDYLTFDSRVSNANISHEYSHLKLKRLAQ